MLRIDSWQTAGFRRVLLDLACIAAIVFSISRVFYNEMDAGKSFSKMNLLAAIDHWQAPLSDKPFALGDDPSASLEHIPNEIYSARQSAAGAVPLWNSLSGGGRPFVAEFQTLNWSTLRTIFPFSDKTAYELGLLFKLLAAGLGTYFLCRRLKISAFSALAASFAFMLCGRNLQWLELCNNYFLFPWLNLCFCWMAAKPGLLRGVLTAFAVAACAYNMHPESFFCGVLAATFLGFDEFKRKSVSDVFRYGAWISLVAFISILISAPLLLPFLEFMANSASYKFDDAAIAFVKYFDFLADLSLPVSQIPYFCGTALGLVLPLGCAIFWKEQRKALVICFLANLLFCIRPGPFETIFSGKPFVFMLAEYPLATVILLHAVCAAAGLDELANLRYSKRFRILCLSPVLLISAIVLFGQTSLGNQIICRITDFAYPKPDMPVSLLLGSALIQLLVCLRAFRQTSQSDERERPLALAFLFLLVGLNTWTIADSLAYAKLDKATHPVEYRQIGNLKLVRDSGERMVATGYDAFQPNTNLVYGIDDFRAFAPIHPRRYKEFTDLAGFTSKFCFIQNCPYDMNHLFDLASVRYVLSERCPVSSPPAMPVADWERRHPGGIESKSHAAIKLADGLRFENAEASFEAATHSIKVKVTFDIEAGNEARYTCSFDLLNARRMLIYSQRWGFDSIDQEGTPLSNHRYQITQTIPLPHDYFEPTLEVKMMIRDNWRAQPLNRGTHIAELQIANILPAVDAEPRFYRLPGDSNDGFALFENLKALPRAYLVHKFKYVPNESESLKSLADRAFDWHHSALIERDPSSPDPAALALGPQPASADPHWHPDRMKELVRILDRDADSVQLLAQNKTFAYLILTDSFYPGWKAYVDGTPVSIYPANHAFRAIPLLAGRHFVSFRFEPESFATGVLLMQAGLGLGIVLLFAGIFQQLRVTKKENSEESAQPQNQTPSQVS